MSTRELAEPNQANSNQKKAGIVILLLLKTILSNAFNVKESPFIIIKVSNYWKLYLF